jgi:hypothetical protein
VTSFSARVSSAGAGGTIQVRAGSATGTVLGSATVSPTGSWETFTTVNGSIASPPAGTTTLYLTFSGGAGALFDVDSFTFTTGGGTGGGAGPVTGLGAGASTSTARSARTARSCSSTAATAPAPAVDGRQRRHAAGARPLPGREVGRHRRRHGGAAVDVQRHRRAGLAAQTDGTLRNPQSGRCLEVAGTTAADRLPTRIADCTTADNQKWDLP